MSKIFTRTFRVRWSEQNASGQVGPASYLRYLVETAYDWGETLGLGAESVETLGLFWLIRETEIHLLRPLRHNDVFDFTIWMVNWQRVRGTRCFELKLKESGEVIAQGSQHIVCMDVKTQRPASPPEEIINNFRLDDPRVFPFERFPKISAFEGAFVTQRQVELGGSGCAGARQQRGLRHLRGGGRRAGPGLPWLDSRQTGRKQAEGGHALRPYPVPVPGGVG